MIRDYDDKLGKLIKLHNQVAGINPALKKCYPVAVVVEDDFLVHDRDPETGQYHFVQQFPSPMPVPKGVSAAFQLEGYGGRIACVISPEIFDTPGGYVTILHEFVHCYQYEICEQTLKMQLDIARKAQQEGDPMWEIQHPFPYNSNIFIRSYPDLLDALNEQNDDAVAKIRGELRSYLGVHDFEYMVWQEWKEGFARWVENCVNREFGLPENKGGLEQPFSRVTFYAGGETLINYFSKKRADLVTNLPELFHKMLSI